MPEFCTQSCFLLRRTNTHTHTTHLDEASQTLAILFPESTPKLHGSPPVRGIAHGIYMYWQFKERQPANRKGYGQKPDVALNHVAACVRKGLQKIKESACVCDWIITLSPCHEKASIIKLKTQSYTVSKRNVFQMFFQTQIWSSLSSQLSTFCSFLSFHFNLSSAGLAMLAQVAAAEILHQLPEAFRVPFFSFQWVMFFPHQIAIGEQGAKWRSKYDNAMMIINFKWSWWI